MPLTCLPPQATPEYGQVKRVQDGTTILVDIQGHLKVVRYLGIQSPQNLPYIQYMGPPAATQNASLVQGQIVQLMPDGALHDQNGQLLRYVLLYNTQTFVNFELLRLGLARTVPDSEGLACYDTFNLVQQQAQIAELGLWAPSPTLFPSATPRPTRTATLTATPCSNQPVFGYSRSQQYSYDLHPDAKLHSWHTNSYIGHCHTQPQHHASHRHQLPCANRDASPTSGLYCYAVPYELRYPVSYRHPYCQYFLPGDTTERERRIHRDQKFWTIIGQFV